MKTYARTAVLCAVRQRGYRVLGKGFKIQEAPRGIACVWRMRSRFQILLLA